MTKNSFQLDYPFWDRALHYLAFNSTGLQLKLAEFESQEHLANLKSLSVQQPVFVCGLPRSGTTLLLNLLSKTSEFCCQTYADMPFVLTPLLWSRFRDKFGKQAKIQERAHGDGIQISLEAPEAFEEMLFKAWYPQHYSGAVLTAENDTYSEQFIDFFKKHIIKLMLRDCKQRYLSKNNANISRVSFLRQSFPDAKIVVMYRAPLEQAFSLLKQHTNFIKLHRSNSFSVKFMAALGHFDFGINLKPINFDGWAERTPYQADNINYWLAYWLATYQHLLNSDANLRFVCYNSLCENPKSQLADIAQYLNISKLATLELAGLVRRNTDEMCRTKLKADRQLLKEVQTLYQQLRQ